MVFASLLNIYYVEDHGIYLEGLFSWRMRYHREASKTYNFSHVHFGRGVHNESLYYITVFAEDIFNRGLSVDIYLFHFKSSSLWHWIMKDLRSSTLILNVLMCLILVLYLPDRILVTLLQNATVAAFIQDEVWLVIWSQSMLHHASS